MRLHVPLVCLTPVSMTLGELQPLPASLGGFPRPGDSYQVTTFV